MWRPKPKTVKYPHHNFGCDARKLGLIDYGRPIGLPGCAFLH